MREGERQVSPSIDGIRADHTARYRWAAERLKGKSVMDVGCGIGYGSFILGESCQRVRGYDIDVEAIEYGKEHYKRKNVSLNQADASDLGPFRGVDAAVCFEMIEHISDPAPMLKRIARSTDTLLASVPNQSVFPYRNHRFHFRHYTAQQFEELLNRCGWEVREWHGQEGPESDVAPAIQGRTLLAVCSRSDEPAGGTWETLPPPPRTSPKSVAIVAMGKSASTYLALCTNRGSRKLVAEQTWAINAMGGVIDHDLLFAMDDCEVQEARAARKPGSNVGGLMSWLKTHNRFFTSRKLDDYPGAMEYPLEEVCNAIGATYFNNTVAYAVAYAMFIGVERIALYGCDYSYDHMHKSESGRGCVEFLLGMAAARGIHIEVASDSTLLDANVPDQFKPYGYDAYDIRFEPKDGGGIAVVKELRDELPTPEEIEIRYKHEDAPGVAPDGTD